MRTQWTSAGRLAKASTGEDGTPHLEVLASGPEMDFHGERMSREAREQIVQNANGGLIYFTPSHSVPLNFGKSVAGTMDGEGRVFIDFALAKENPLAMQLFEEVQKGEWTDRQVSVGGWATRKAVRDQETGATVREITSTDIRHCALTFPQNAAYPSAALVGAVTKAFEARDEGELAKAGWSKEEVEQALSEASASGADETPTEPPDIGKEVAKALEDSGLVKAITDLRAKVDELAKAVTAPPPPPPAPPTPPEPDPPPEPPKAPVTKDIPDTDPQSAPYRSPPEDGEKAAKARRRDELKKAMEAQGDPLRRAAIQQELNALNAQ